MMDTDAIYSAVSDYGWSCHRRDAMDVADHLLRIRMLLNEADEEHKSLLAENERLVDEVGSLKAERIAYASEFPPIPDGDDAGLPAVDRIHENIRRLKAENAELKSKLTDKASLLRGCYARIDKLEKAMNSAHDHIDLTALEVSHCKDAAIIREALEKKHEGAT